MKRKIRKTIRSFSVGYEKYHKEILATSASLQKKFSKHMVFIFLAYTTFMLLVDVLFWGEWNVKNCYGYIISLISLINWQLFAHKIPQKRGKTILAGNSYISLLLLILVLMDYLSDGYISIILLSCVILSTSMLCLNPLHYSVMITIAMVIAGIIDWTLRGLEIQMVFYYWIDNLAVWIVALEISFLVSGLRYQQFKEKAKLVSESTTDSLTGLYNRKYFEQYFARRFRRNTLSAMLHMDLDNFKTLNDTLGHEQGDKLLCQAADILKKCFRKSDCVARIGGDEFMVFMPDFPNKKVALDRVKQILKHFPIVCRQGEKAVEVSVSIGIVFNEREAATYEELYKKADTAMYRAKEAGKGQAVIYRKK
ncbi:MAG: GGDEF domain-containing protein [Lachnospiraceae bacterium]|nr:GGDEF domain-containing protein [Lachnospiraceae bacterium]